ncbi:helix-turn-helix domain-containing protein [Labrenzia sp. R4_1]|uniref:helix-turn-helix domain-containing protein n=1 Tax=Labrenzia sp. R4_1 TaxID=2821106 RepID=UPI001ADD585D|nr:helix-turn-helix domain-containing protein [Labrenzia sp. R4_1]
MPLLQQNDILFAHKALGLMPDLSAATRRVAAAIIDHFNKRTGQCDPSIGRLMKLLKISRAAVIRATNELDELGLIEKKSHGGKSHRTAYSSNWPMFRAFVDDWDAGMKSGEGPAHNLKMVSDLRPPKSQSCDLGRLRNDTQTHRKNPSKKLIEHCRVDKPGTSKPDLSRTKDPKKLVKKEQKEIQQFISLPPQGRQSLTRSEVARDKAQQRWEGDIMKQREAQKVAIVEWLTADRMEKVTDAEIGQPGGGLIFILGEMSRGTSRA